MSRTSLKVYGHLRLILEPHPGGAADLEDTHPAIEISALPTSDRRRSDILREESRAAHARDRKPMSRNGTVVPSLPICSIQGGSNHATSSGATPGKGDGGLVSTARRHSPIETSETQAMVLGLQVGDGSLTARTNGQSPFEDGNTQSVPGLQIVSSVPCVARSQARTVVCMDYGLKDLSLESASLQ